MKKILIGFALLAILNNSYAEPEFQAGSGIFHGSQGLLEINITWSGFETVSGGVQTLTFDTDAEINPYTYGVTELVSSSIAGASLISTSDAIGTQALIIDLDGAISTPGNHNFTFVFSNVTNSIIASSMDVGGNWDGFFFPLEGNFQLANQYNVVSDAPVPAVIGLLLD